MLLCQLTNKSADIRNSMSLGLVVLEEKLIKRTHTSMAQNNDIMSADITNVLHSHGVKVPVKYPYNQLKRKYDSKVSKFYSFSFKKNYCTNLETWEFFKNISCAKWKRYILWRHIPLASEAGTGPYGEWSALYRSGQRRNSGRLFQALGGTDWHQTYSCCLLGKMY